MSQSHHAVALIAPAWAHTLSDCDTLLHTSQRQNVTSTSHKGPRPSVPSPIHARVRFCDLSFPMTPPYISVRWAQGLIQAFLGQRKHKTRTAANRQDGNQRQAGHAALGAGGASARRSSSDPRSFTLPSTWDRACGEAAVRQQ